MTLIWASTLTMRSRRSTSCPLRRMTPSTWTPALMCRTTRGSLAKRAPCTSNPCLRPHLCYRLRRQWCITPTSSCMTGTIAVMGTIAHGAALARAAAAAPHTSAPSTQLPTKGTTIVNKQGSIKASEVKEENAMEKQREELPKERKKKREADAREAEETAKQQDNRPSPRQPPPPPSAGQAKAS